MSTDPIIVTDLESALAHIQRLQSIIAKLLKTPDEVVGQVPLQTDISLAVRIKRRMAVVMEEL